jgi:hypothetical protein
MLDTGERVVIDEVIQRVERGGGNAVAKLRRLLALPASASGLEYTRLCSASCAPRSARSSSAAYS